MIEDVISGMACAEDLFDVLGVPYDPSVLAIHRLHVLKRFGEAAAAIDTRSPSPGETERRVLYAEALRQVHEHYREAGGGGGDVFRGLQGGLGGSLVNLGSKRSRT